MNLTLSHLLLEHFPESHLLSLFVEYGFGVHPRGEATVETTFSTFPGQRIEMQYTKQLG